MLNYTAVVMWLFMAGVGFLMGDIRGAVIGGVVGVGISLAAELFS